jgi:hypothetical protein
MFNSSKWSYIGVGICFMVAIFAALMHSSVLLIVNAALVVWNWYVAEHLRQAEDNALIDAYELVKETMAKLKEEEGENKK